MTQPIHGIKTGEFGKWLTKFLSNNPEYHHYVVYYDHGDKETSPNVVAIKGFYGVEITRGNKFSDVDVMVVNPNREIMLVIEIEERPSSPKKIVGDIVANLVCNRYAVRLGNENQYFEITPETMIILAGTISTKGSKVTQLEEVIIPRLQELVSPQDGINQNNVAYVFRKDIESTIEALKQEMIRLLS